MISLFNLLKLIYVMSDIHNDGSCSLQTDIHNRIMLILISSIYIQLSINKLYAAICNQRKQETEGNSDTDSSNTPNKQIKAFKSNGNRNTFHSCINIIYWHCLSIIQNNPRYQ